MTAVDWGISAGTPGKNSASRLAHGAQLFHVLCACARVGVARPQLSRRKHTISCSHNSPRRRPSPQHTHTLPLLPPLTAGLLSPVPKSPPTLTQNSLRSSETHTNSHRLKHSLSCVGHCNLANTRDEALLKTVRAR